MTQQESEQHPHAMQGMTEQERGQYREEMHVRPSERATQKGISAPASPGLQGLGSRAGGMGPGGGMSGAGGMGGAEGLGGGRGSAGGGGGGGMGDRH